MWKFAALLVGLAAAGLMAFAIVDGLAVRSLLADGVETAGRVVRVEKSQVRTDGKYGSGNTTVYEASVRFTDGSGASHVARSVPTFAILRDDDLRTVWYRRDDPDSARAFDGSPWSRPRMFAVGSVLTAALAFAVYCTSRLARARVAALRP